MASSIGSLTPSHAIENKISYLESVQIQVIVDNNVDISSPSTIHPDLDAHGTFGCLLTKCNQVTGRGKAHVENKERLPVLEFKTSQVCHGANGLSLLITARTTKSDIGRSILFDTGPDGNLWEANATKMDADLSLVEVIVISHWHINHTGGLLRAIKLINKARSERGIPGRVIVDVNPSRPDFRGLHSPLGIISFEADPTFREIKQAGGRLSLKNTAHNILSDMFLISGTIKIGNDWELGDSIRLRFFKTQEEWKPEATYSDERIMACAIRGGRVVAFTSCSQNGLINGLTTVKDTMFPNLKLFAVIGGFHLSLYQEDKLKRTMKHLTIMDPQLLIAGGCTGWRGIDWLNLTFHDKVVPSKVGASYTILKSMARRIMSEQSSEYSDESSLWDEDEEEEEQILETTDIEEDLNEDLSEEVDEKYFDEDYIDEEDLEEEMSLTTSPEEVEL